MSEEVTYATLTFQDSVAAGNIRDTNNLRKRGRSSEKARCDFRGWAAVKCLEVLALRRMLKRGVLWNLQNGDQVGESSICEVEYFSFYKRKVIREADKEASR